MVIAVVSSARRRCCGTPKGGTPRAGGNAVGSVVARKLSTTWWPKKSWPPVLQKLGIRRRKFYATRHTFVSWALTSGMNLKALAEYVGTSVAMIEKSYGRYISDRGLGGNCADRETTGKVSREGGGRQPKRERSQGGAKWSQGESNPRLRRERPPS